MGHPNNRKTTLESVSHNSNICEESQEHFPSVSHKTATYEEFQEHHFNEEQDKNKHLNLDTPKRNIPPGQEVQPRKLFKGKRKEKMDFKERNKIHKIIENIEDMDLEFLLINTLTITAKKSSNSYKQLLKK